MTTVIKIFTFDTDAEGFVDQGGAMAAAYDGADGSPSAGCFGFSGDPNGGDGGEALLNTTWEALGVWPGATVTQVEAISYKINYDSPDYLELYASLKNLDNMLIVSHPIEAYGTISGPTGWIADVGITGALPLGSPQASDTGIKFVINVYSEHVGATTIKLDTITLAITFTGGTDPTPPAVDLGGGWRIMNGLVIQRLRRGDEEIILLRGRRSQS